MKPARYQTVRAIHVRAAANDWVRLRPMRTAPAIVVIGTLLYLAGFPAPRLWVVVGIHAALLIYQLREARRAERVGVGEQALFISHLVITTGHAVIVTLTGGLASPIWPSLLGNTLGTLFMFGRSRESAIAVGYVVALVAAIAPLPISVTGPPLERTYFILLAGWSILFTLFLLRKSSFAMAQSYQQIGETLDRAREDILVSNRGRAQSLECIGAKVAHELKNPLSAIKGLVQLEQRAAKTDRSRERLEVIGAEVARMEGILRDYLSFSRPLEDLKPEAVDLAAIVDETLAVLEARAEAAHVTVSRVGENHASATGDPRRLKEALLNIVANALEATPPGGSVEVTLAEDREGASVVVRDTGKGITEAELGRIGTPFFTTREGGTGLGVVLARAAIRQHGGEVTFSSEPGQGTTVTVTLPVCAAPKAEGEHPGELEEASATHG